MDQGYTTQTKVEELRVPEKIWNAQLMNLDERKVFA
jgi:hypothetical protein